MHKPKKKKQKKQKTKNKKQKIISLILSVNLESAYLTEIEIFLKKVLYIKLKVN